MIEYLLQLVATIGDWMTTAVVTPVMTTLLDYPWLSGLVLFAVLAVIVGDTALAERAQERREEATQR
jgi:membrane protein implicated in regulation of membrane protease activity